MYANIQNKRAYDVTYYAQMSPERKTQKYLRQQMRLKTISAAIREYKLRHPCSCGESHFACLEFHHISDDKEISVANAVKRGWSIERVMSEIEKCRVLCANCHRKLHYSK